MSSSLAPAAHREPYGADLTSPERRRHPRFPLALAGRFMRADKREYPCRLNDISVDGASMSTTAELEIGENIIAYIAHLGGLEGPVVRVFDQGFAMRLTATQHKRNKLAAQIMRLINLDDISDTDEREHPRTTPGNDVTTLRFADGTTAECQMLDVSVSGASLITRARPPIGEEIVLGRQRALVVRHHERGIGVQFLNHTKEDPRAS